MHETHKQDDGVREKWASEVDTSLSGHEHRLDDLETFRIQHLSLCHPEIAKQFNNLERRWAIIAGVGTGLGVSLGYLGGRLIDLWFTG